VERRKISKKKGSIAHYNPRYDLAFNTKYIHISLRGEYKLDYGNSCAMETSSLRMFHYTVVRVVWLNVLDLDNFIDSQYSTLQP
jgi:hypothetical protein